MKPKENMNFTYQPKLVYSTDIEQGYDKFSILLKEHIKIP